MRRPSTWHKTTHAPSHYQLEMDCKINRFVSSTSMQIVRETAVNHLLFLPLPWLSPLFPIYLPSIPSLQFPSLSPTTLSTCSIPSFPLSPVSHSLPCSQIPTSPQTHSLAPHHSHSPYLLLPSLPFIVHIFPSPTHLISMTWLTPTLGTLFLSGLMS